MSAVNEHGVPRKMRETYEAIVGIADECRHGHLNDECAELIEGNIIAQAASRYRPRRRH